MLMHPHICCLHRILEMAEDNDSGKRLENMCDRFFSSKQMLTMDQYLYIGEERKNWRKEVAEKNICIPQNCEYGYVDFLRVMTALDEIVFRRGRRYRISDMDNGMQKIQMTGA